MNLFIYFKSWRLRPRSPSIGWSYFPLWERGQNCGVLRIANVWNFNSGWPFQLLNPRCLCLWSCSCCMSLVQSLALSLGAWLRTAVSTQCPLHCGGFRAASGHGAQINGTAYVLCYASRRVAHQPRCLMAVVLPTFAKTTNKSSRAVALGAVMDREPPSVHCLITRWGLSFININ